MYIYIYIHIYIYIYYREREREGEREIHLFPFPHAHATGRGLVRKDALRQISVALETEHSILKTVFAAKAAKRKAGNVMKRAQ